MKKYIYITLITLLSVSCETDNVGPLLDNLDIIFFMEDGIEVQENSTDDIVIEIGSSKGGNAALLTLGGTAVLGTDYTVAEDLNIAFSEGSYSTSITISLIDNILPEDDHTIIVSLPTDQGYSDSNRREFVVNIINDEVSSGTVVVSISDVNDDVEEGETGAMLLDSSDLELGEFDTSGTPDQGLQTLGLRFNNINIPVNATILSASIQFTADDIGSDPVELTIFGEDIGNAEEYSTIDFDLTSRTKTTASAVWSVPEWLTKAEQDAPQKTVDISVVVQAIVSRGDWASDNSINFIFEHSGPSIGVMSSSGGREAETFGEPGDTEAAFITIDWEL